VLITSYNNDFVKEISKLKNRKYREKKSLFLIEGRHLVIEAYKAGILKKMILEKDAIFPLNVETIYFTNDIINRISTMKSPSDVMGLCEIKYNKEILGNRVLILDDIQDPGNMGTIIRSAVAFNIDTIILGDCCVDIYNPKVLRSTQGMIFHMNFVKQNLLEIIPVLKEKGFMVYGTDVEFGINVKDFNALSKFALVMGNEGNGVSMYVRELCDKNFYIDMNNSCESLNVGVACSIILYQLDK